VKNGYIVGKLFEEIDMSNTDQETKGAYNISAPQSVRSTLVTHNTPEDFILPRATSLQGQKVAHLQAPYSF
jgi:NAD dependent epimerase/dehydratase family enzyme